MAYPVQQLADGRVRYSDGSVGWPTGNKPTANPTPYLSPKQGGNKSLKAGTTGPHLSASAIPVRCTDTGNIGFTGGVEYPRASVLSNAGGTAPSISPRKYYRTSAGVGSIPVPAPVGTQDPNSVTNEQDQLNSILDIIRSKLSEARRMAQERVAQAGSLRDETLGQIGQFRDRAKQYNTEDLSKIMTSFDGIKGNARQTSQDIEAKNRAAARGLGRFGTSTYENALFKGNENLGKQLGNINLEQASNNQEANRLLDNRYTQADANATNAQDQYATSMSNANALENQGLLDYGTDVNSAQTAYNQRLQAQDNANQQLALLRQQVLGQTTGLTGRNVNTGGVLDILNSQAPSLTAPATSQTASTGFSPDSGATNTNILDLIKKRSGLYATQ